MLYFNPNDHASAEVISLRSISRTAKNKAELAAIAAGIYDSRRPLCDFGLSELALLFHAPVSAINKQRTRKKRERRKTTLTEAFMCASPEERIEAVRVIGPDAVWDVIVLAIDHVAAPAKMVEELTAKLEEPLDD